MKPPSKGQQVPPGWGQPVAGVQGRVDGQEKGLRWVENAIAAMKGCRHGNGVT